MDNSDLVLDLLEWVAGQPRSYDDVLDAWRTSCPRLTIWEDAVDAEFVRVESAGRAGKIVSITEQGSAFLRDSGRVVNSGKTVA